MTTEQRRTEFHTLAHLQPGRTLAWISDPLGVTSDPLVTAVNKAALGVVALDVRLAEIIKANGDVHTAAKTEHVAAQMRYSAAAGELGAAREKHAEREDALYLPPVAKPAEVTSDVELRAWLFSLNAEARKRALDQCAKGEFLDLLIAGARFAAPEPCALEARAIYRARQIEIFPQRVADLERDAELIAWAHEVLRHLQSIFDAATNIVGPSPLLVPAPLPVQRAA